MAKLTDDQIGRLNSYFAEWCSDRGVFCGELS